MPFHVRAAALCLPLAFSTALIANYPALAQSSKKHATRIAAIPAALKTPSAQFIDPELRSAIDHAPKATQWPEENYASILDTADITVKPDGVVVAEYRLAYKLFNERARDLAEVNLPYNDGYQKLEVLSARTIRKNGTIMAVKREDIRTQSPYSEYLMYDDSKTVGFSMPGIEDDSVVEYRWRLTTRPFIPGQFSESWTFSQPFPVSLSRLTLHVPSAKSCQYKVYNNDKVKPAVTTSANGQMKTLTWEMRDIAPLEEEPDMPELADVHTWMEISSIKDWQEMAKWYNGLVKPQTVADPALRNTVQQLIAGKTTDEQKARALYDFAANRVRYVGLEFGISAFKPHAANAVHEKLYGDCKDKATLLITMLDLAGIKAYPALLYAETERPIRTQLPTLEAFDHCIAVADVGGKEVWLDATAETCEFGDIPSGDRGSDAFVIRNGVGQFKTIPRFKEDENSIVSTNLIKLRPDRSGEMDIEMTFHGASAQEWRSYARSLTPEKRRQMVSRMVPPGGTLKDYSMPDGMTKSGPFVLKLKLDIPRMAKKTGGLLLLGLPSTMGSSQRNPYSKEDRVWPILNRQNTTSRSVTTIVLPDGYAVEEMPDPITVKGPLTEYDYNASRSTDGKTLTVNINRTTREGRISPADYAKVRAFHDKLLETSDEQLIVLRKSG